MGVGGEGDRERGLGEVSVAVDILTQQSDLLHSLGVEGDKETKLKGFLFTKWKIRASN